MRDMAIRHGGLFALTIYDVMRAARRGLAATSIREAVIERTGIPLSVRKVRDYLRTVDYAGLRSGCYRVVREGGACDVRYRLVERRNDNADPDGPGGD